MRAGFAKTCITPPPHTPVVGVFGYDSRHESEGVHDDLFARALYLEDGGETVVIIGCDLLFFNRAEADRYTAAIGRKLDLAPRQVLLNCSHTHAGPSIGSWAFTGYPDCIPPDPLYEDAIERALAQIAVEAKAAAREVTMTAGVTEAKVPVSRRKLNADGLAEWKPDFDAPSYDRIPICLLRDTDGQPVCLLFSVSCHPSTVRSHFISADYPGPAMDKLDEYLGVDCSLFLQGVGGDTKAYIIGDVGYWRSGTWEEVAEVGRVIADRVISAVEGGLTPVEPDLHAAAVETAWPLDTLPTREELVALRDNPDTEDLKRRWANKMITRLDRGEPLPTAAPILLQGVQLGAGVRIAGLEGEAVAEWGHLMDDYYGSGITFPLGYIAGTQLYLPISRMIDEKGYEVVSYHEYGFPAGFVKGMEAIVRAGLDTMKTRGVR